MDNYMFNMGIGFSVEKTIENLIKNLKEMNYRVDDFKNILLNNGHYSQYIKINNIWFRLLYWDEYRIFHQKNKRVYHVDLKIEHYREEC